MRPFSKLLINRAGNSSFKQQGSCVDALMDIYRVLTANDPRDLGSALEAIMDITERPPGLLKASKDQVVTRLQIFLRIQQEYGQEQ